LRTFIISVDLRFEADSEQHENPCRVVRNPLSKRVGWRSPGPRVYHRAGGME